MKKNLIIFCVVILGIFFINNNCLAFSVSEVIYKKFKTREYSNKKIVVVKLIMYSESILISDEKGLNKFNIYQNLIKKVTDCYLLKNWEKNDNYNFSNFTVITESIEFFVDTDRKRDVVWAYLWSYDLSKLFNKTKYRPKIETSNEFFNRILDKTENSIKRKYDLE